MRKPSLTIALAALCMSTGAQMSEPQHTYSIEELFALADQNNSTIRAHHTATASAAHFNMSTAAFNTIYMYALTLITMNTII